MQHSTLTLERWSSFNLDQQILMIANEMHRASKLFAATDRARLTNAYERALNLTDLTIAAQLGRSLRRELLRWRDILAGLYVQEEPDPAQHQAALHVLLLFTVEAAKQRPFLCPS